MEKEAEKAMETDTTNRGETETPNQVEPETTDQIESETTTKPAEDLNAVSERRKRPRILFTLLGVILACFIFIIGFLYMSSYDIKYELKTFSEYWEENHLLEQFSSEGNQIEMTIPENVINTELMVWINKLFLPSRYKVINAQLRSEGHRIQMNGRLYGISFPVSASFEPVLKADKIVIDFKQVTIGESINLSETNSKKLMGFLFQDNIPIILDSKTLFHSDILKINSVDWKEKNFIVNVQMNEKLLKTEIYKIKNTVNTDLLAGFENSTTQAEKLAAHYIKDFDQLTDSDMNLLIKDMVSSGEITRHLLMLAEPATYKELMAVYGDNLKGLDPVQFLKDRNTLLSKQLTVHDTALFNALENQYFSQEPMHINKGRLYSALKNVYVTPTFLTQEQGLQIPEQTLKRLSFYYNKDNKVLALAYKLDEEEYLVLHKGEFAVISANTFKESLKFEDTGNVSRVNDLKTWNSLLNEVKSLFQEEEVFIRYMKADDKYAFVVASPGYNYQSLKAIAFEKVDDQWKILDQDVETISELNNAHPAFNLETVTMEIEKVNIYQLGEDMYDVILEDMLDKNEITSKKGLTITYCSYGDAYIAFTLSNKKEYVYKVYSMYLQAILDKATAEKTWEDLPDIITLQDPPLE